MKKVFKIIGIILLSIIGIYSLFIVEESIRLSKNVDTKPAIVFFKSDLNKSVDDEVIYYSLGFKLVNKYGSYQVDDKRLDLVIVGQEFWLFDTFMLWGWIS